MSARKKPPVKNAATRTMANGPGEDRFGYWTVSRSTAAKMLSVNIPTIDGWIAATTLRASKPGRRVLIRGADIDAMLDASAV